MEGINKKYDIVMEVLTPLNIGAGAEKDWVKGVDYIVKGNTLYKLSLKKIAKEGIDLTKLSSYFAQKNNDGVSQIIGNKLDAVCDLKKTIPNDSDNDIKSFIKNQLTGNPVIPGSSIKGAIRSIMFDYLRDNERNEKEVFGSSNDGDEFMRFIKLSDIEFEKTELVNTKIFNLQGGDNHWRGGWKHELREGTNSKYNPIGFNTIYESIEPGQKSIGTIMLSEKAFNLFGKKLQKNGDKKEKLLSIDNFFSVINQHTKEYLQKEKAFFEKFSTDKTERIIYSIDRLLDQIPTNNNYCIFKMSAGSGFHSITGDWQFDDYSSGILDRKRDRNAKPKSRKIAINGDIFSLMGFVKLRILSEAEINELKGLKEERILKIAEEQAETARKREEEERLEKEQLLKTEKYESLIVEAKELEANNEYELAYSIYKQAKDLLSEGKKHDDAIIRLEKLFQQIEIEKKRQKIIDEANRQAEEEKKVRISKGLEILNEKFDQGPNEGQYKVKDFKVVKSKVEQWMKQSGNKNVSSDQYNILSETLSRIFASITKEKDKNGWLDIKSNIWKDVETWTSTEVAHQIFNSVIKS